jgi:hypothetical protein
MEESDETFSTMTTDDDDSIMETSSQCKCLYQVTNLILFRTVTISDSISSTNSLNTTISDSTIQQYRGKLWSHSYPPTNQSGPVLPHDLPYFEYGRKGQLYDIVVFYVYLFYFDSFFFFYFIWY